jgi:hypothetical protein
MATPHANSADVASNSNSTSSNGWLNDLNGSHYAIGYYENDDAIGVDTGKIPYLTNLLRNYVLVNSYHSSMIAQSHPNRIYEHSGTTDRWDNGGCRTDGNTVLCDGSYSTLQSIWDLLGSSSYYFQADNYLTTFWRTSKPQDKGGIDEVFLPSLN